MEINTEFIVIIEAKIIDPENLINFLKIWNSRVNSPSKYEQFINGENLRIIEIYSNSEDCLNHIKTHFRVNLWISFRKTQTKIK